MVALLICGAIFWFALQFHGWRAARWERRWKAFLPVIRWIAEDVRAVRRNTRGAWKRYRLRRQKIDDETLRQMWEAE